MFKNLKTSTQISIKFTLFTIFQLVLLCLLANSIFFHNWYNRELDKLSVGEDQRGHRMMRFGPIPEFFQANRPSFDINSDEAKEILSLKWIGNVGKLDDLYFMYSIDDGKLLLSNVTPQVTMQFNLILISLYLTLILGGLSYLLSLYFVKSSMRKLNDLNSFLDNLDIDNLDSKIQINGPQDDEINKVSHKFNQSLDKIYNQTLSLKDFIKNASHELKTPLMTINTEIDFTRKSKNYDEGLVNIKKQLMAINSLLDSLLSITKAESMNQLSKEDINITNTLKEIVANLSSIYKSKEIVVHEDLPDDIIIKSNSEATTIILKNLLDNAFKFTSVNGTIYIHLTPNSLMIKDSGFGIDPENIDRIWERFWQADESNSDTKSFGLGLYLTKMLIDKLGWKIEVESALGIGTSFRVVF